MSSSRNRRTRASRRREGSSLSSFSLSPSENPSARHLRVQSTLFQEVSLLFRGELSDPRLEGVSLSSFELSPDGRLVRIGYTLTPESAASGPRPVQDALERASGYLRSQLAQHLNLKRVPQLRFIYVGVAERQAEAPEPLADESEPDAGLADALDTDSDEPGLADEPDADSNESEPDAGLADEFDADESEPDAALADDSDEEGGER